MINGIEGASFSSIEEVTGRYLQNTQEKSGRRTATDGRTFAEILSEKTGSRKLRFSKHATQRLFDRNISLSSKQLERLTEGTDRAESKGINDTLVMVDGLAFIVNTGSNTVVTAMDSSEANGNVFSNIDGAVIA